MSDEPAEWQQERKRLRTALTNCLGLIVEFGDLNGFRNMTDQELGSSVQAVAREAAEVLSDSPEGRAMLLRRTASSPTR